jgi:peptide alpha-N-acetyltransferase
MQDLVEMQCMWFALEVGRSFARKGQNGKALKRFHQIAKYFYDFTDDQFDFHTYCLRKMTLRSYVDLLRFEDGLRGRKEFVNAAVDAVRIYLKLADNPAVAVEELNQIGMSKLKLAADSKTAESKKLTQQLQQQQQKQTADNKKSIKDDDPFGEKYLKVCKITRTLPLIQRDEKDIDFLGQASKFVRSLQKYAFAHLSTHLLAGEIYLRQRKYLLAFKALTLARQLDAESPDVYSLAVRFWKLFLSSSPGAADEMSVVAREVIEEGMEREYPEIASSRSITQYSQKYLDRAVSNGNAAQVIKGTIVFLH